MITPEEKVNFGLPKIEIDQFAFFKENWEEGKTVNYSTQIQFKIGLDNKSITATTGFEFLQEEKCFLKIQVSCLFVVEPKSWDKFIKEDAVVIPKGFLAHIAAVTVGTTRGALFTKTEGFPFQKYILPPINVNEIVTDDFAFNLSDNENNQD